MKSSCSTISYTSPSTSAMTGTSQCEMSEPNMALKRAPNGLAFVLNAVTVIGSSASHPQKNGAANRSRISSASSMPTAANSSRSATSCSG